MKVQMLWADRVHDRTPELLEAWDEFSIDSNPEGWDDAVKKARASLGTDLNRWAVITVKVNRQLIEDILDPSMTIDGVITDVVLGSDE